MNAIQSLAAHAQRRRWPAIYCMVLAQCVLLGGCALPSAPMRPAVYDFGPGARMANAEPGGAALPALTLAEVQTSSALDSNALLYRLVYSDAQQLQPYALARWSMPPAQLLQQRLREALGQHHSVLGAGGVASAGRAQSEPMTLHTTLEEFSQLFDAPQSSVGLVRLRATLVRTTPAGERIVAQRSVVVQQPASSPDAAGGVRALTGASDAAVRELAQWVASFTAARGSSSGQR